MLEIYYFSAIYIDEAPNNNSYDTIFLNPIFDKIFSKLFPLGKVFEDLCKYL
jgi:hypothetical protein